jgi:hypothetical protein
MIRFVQIALLIAVMIPVAWAIKSGHAMLPNEAKWLVGGVPLGMAIMLALGFRHRDDKRGV